jgi:hypothetical protein
MVEAPRLMVLVATVSAFLTVGISRDIQQDGWRLLFYGARDLQHNPHDEECTHRGYQ